MRVIMPPNNKPTTFLVVGRAGMDIYAEPVGTAIENTNAFSAHLGGSAANIAVGLVRLGQRADLLTTLSDDAVGNFCLNQLDYFGVGRDNVQQVGGGARTSLAVSESRLEYHQTVIYRNGAADFALSEEAVNKISLPPYSGIIFTGTALAKDPSRTALFSLARRAKKEGVKIIFDIDYRPYTWEGDAETSQVYSDFATYCDVIVGNEEEFAVLKKSAKQNVETARNLVSDGASIAVYKMGAAGSITIHKDGEFKTGIFPVTALKPVGAGDAFLAAFLGGGDRSMSLRDNVVRASAAAAMVVSRPGCSSAMPTRAELESFLANNTETEIVQA
jgi:5-dehydro-2-deoxygluconokinase